ncbi:unnamed protein product [Dibothriocephalus latus]|uniref:Uncharacterized protein n=1 Tax=Dibothriocephalus latus TaxID=60516 RepID=A0A3P7NEJ0_DIBLA|nr:unnamed protein product [Dibothriocephalus latus]
MPPFDFIKQPKQEEADTAEQEEEEEEECSDVVGPAE